MLKIAFWRLLAIFFLLLAFIGLLLPGIPTTEFVLLALWASAKGWPALNRWLLAHPKFGPMIDQWQTHRAIPRRAKWIAGISMTISVIWLLSSQAPLWVKCMVPSIMLCVFLWLMMRPEITTAKIHKQDML